MEIGTASNVTWPKKICHQFLSSPMWIFFSEISCICIFIDIKNHVFKVSSPQNTQKLRDIPIISPVITFFSRSITDQNFIVMAYVIVEFLSGWHTTPPTQLHLLYPSRKIMLAIWSEPQRVTIVDYRITIENLNTSKKSLNTLSKDVWINCCFESFRKVQEKEH